MPAIMNRSPLWKYILIVFIIIAGFIYAAPNLYPEYPAVQIMAANEKVTIDDQVLAKASEVLQKDKITYRDAQFQNETLLFRFASTDLQLKAKEVLQETLGDSYLVAINLSSTTPQWLRAIGASPMKLGLDLRGGVHFLLQVDVDSVMKQRVEGDLRGIGQALRDEKIRYTGITRKSDNQVVVQFRDEASLNDAFRFVMGRYNEF